MEIDAPGCETDNHAEEVCEHQRVASEEESIRNYVQDQLTETQQKLRAMTEERNTFRDKNLALAKRSAILSREMQATKKESEILLMQRNILQGRLDNLEDQEIDIREPRNDPEAEAHASRGRQREHLARIQGVEGRAETDIRRWLDTNLHSFQDASLETELQNAPDKMEDQTLEIIDHQEPRDDLDSLFSGGSDEEPLKNSAKSSPLHSKSNGDSVHQENQTSIALPFAHSGLTDSGMVYGDENSEDLIDWTEDDDEYRIDCYQTESNDASHHPEVSVQQDVPERPVSPQYSATIWIDRDYCQEKIELVRVELEAVKRQRDEVLAKLESRGPPLPQENSPTLLANQYYEEKLNAARAEIDLMKQQRDTVMAELKQLQRDLATRTAERNGARQRIKLLDEEIAERQMTEVQLREELRLGREEDPLADKLFVELVELRKEYEDAEEERLRAEERFKCLQQQVYEADVKRGEDIEKLKSLESVVEKTTGVVESVEHQVQAANAKLRTMSATLDARQLDVQRIHSELLTARNDLGMAQVECKGYQTAIAAVIQERATAQTEANELTAELGYANEERNSARAKSEELALKAKMALAATEAANKVVVDLRKSLNACNDMGYQLRSISNDNITELLMVRDQRDSALLDLVKSTRDLTTANEELERLRTALGTTTEERNNSRASLMAMTDERDHALQDCDNSAVELMKENLLFRSEYERAEENLQSAQIFSNEIERHLKTQENLRKQIEDLTTALDSNTATVEKQARSEIQIQITAPPFTPLDAAYREPIQSDTSSGDEVRVNISEQPDSPTLFINDTPVTSDFPPSRPVPAQGIRKSTRSTRNPAPLYVDPPSPSVPKHNRKRKAESSDEEGPTKKKSL